MTARLALAAALAALALAAAACGDDAPSDPGALKIGLVGAEGDRIRAFELAVEQVNANGGVFGKPVEYVTGEVGSDLDAAVERTRELIEQEGVHVIVGPFSSASSTRIVQEVTGPAGIPSVSPSATAPALAGLADDDFFFRTVLSDAAQAPVLADVIREAGVANVGLSYRDDPYGRGFAEVFRAEWTGGLAEVSVPTDTTDYAPYVRQTAAQGAEALVVVDFASSSAGVVLAALEEGLYDTFFFADGAKSPTVVETVGAEPLAGSLGTAGAESPPVASGPGWDAAYVAKYGALSSRGHVRSTYDAAVVLMLAAEQAGSTDGAAIRDNLRSIGGAPGAVVGATPEGVAEALALIRDGKEIDFEGGSGAIEWDANGDLRGGYMGVWMFTAEGGIEEVDILEIAP